MSTVPSPSAPTSLPPGTRLGLWLCGTLAVLLAGVGALLLVPRRPAVPDGAVGSPDTKAALAVSSHKTQEPEEVRADALLGAYGKNSFAAARRYDGRHLAVTGAVTDTTPTTVTLGFDVVCEIDPASRHALDGLAVGKYFTLAGRCAGERPGGTFHAKHVLLTGCRPVTAPPRRTPRTED